MSGTALITVPYAGDKTLLQFLATQGKELTDAHSEVLNEIARAITERGWVQPVDAVVEKIVDASGLAATAVRAAIGDLVHRRLLTLDVTGARFTGFLGSLAFAQTPHRAHLANRVDVYAHGGMDLLAVCSTLLKSVEIFTRCPVTNMDIKLAIAKEQITASNRSGVSGFMAEWDGVQPLAEVAARSPLFADDLALEQWVAQNPGIKGTELPGDLLLWVGMEAARQLGALRFKLIGHRG